MHLSKTEWLTLANCNKNEIGWRYFIFTSSHLIESKINRTIKIATYFLHYIVTPRLWPNKCVFQREFTCFIRELVIKIHNDDVTIDLVYKDMSVPSLLSLPPVWIARLPVEPVPVGLAGGQNRGEGAGAAKVGEGGAGGDVGWARGAGEEQQDQ